MGRGCSLIETSVSKTFPPDQISVPLHFSEVVVTLKFPWFVDLLSTWLWLWLWLVVTLMFPWLVDLLNTWRSRPRVISARLQRANSPESGKTVIMH